LLALFGVLQFRKGLNEIELETGDVVAAPSASRARLDRTGHVASPRYAGVRISHMRRCGPRHRRGPYASYLRSAPRARAGPRCPGPGAQTRVCQAAARMCSASWPPAASRGLSVASCSSQWPHAHVAKPAASSCRRASQSAAARPWARSSRPSFPHRWSASPPHPSSTSSQLHWSRPSRLLTSTAGQLTEAEAEVARDPRCHRSPSPEHLLMPGTTKIEPQANLHHSPTLSRPSPASSSPDSDHLHPCPRLGPHCKL
jgi:hypothetical protein